MSSRLLTNATGAQQKACNQWQISKPNRQPGARAIDVFPQIKDTRGKVNQHSRQAKDHEPKHDLREDRNVRRPWRQYNWQHVPDYLKENHIQQDAQVS
jgi:hypothetical protein